MNAKRRNGYLKMIRHREIERRLDTRESTVSVGLAVLIIAFAPALLAAQVRVQSYAFPQGGGFTSGGGVRVGVSIGLPMAGQGESPESAAGAGFWYATRDALVIVDTESENPPEGVPADYEIHPNYPNPFNPSTRIRYGVPQAAFVKVGVYNVLGQLVAELVSGEKAAGYHDVDWDGRDRSGATAPSGVYFYRIEAGRWAETRSMVLQK